MTTGNQAAVVSALDATSEYVLPKPPRPHPEVVVVPPALGVEHRRGAAVAALGQRWQVLTECQQQFLGELRSSLEALDAGVAEAARVRLQTIVHQALLVMGWCDAAAKDLRMQAGCAAQGHEPLELAAFAGEVIGDGDTLGVPVHVQGEVLVPWWGDAEALAATLRSACTLVRERNGGRGALVVRLDGDVGRPLVTIEGAGEPVDDLDPAILARFRQTVEELGARVLPTAMGPGGTGLTLELPASSAVLANRGD